MSQYLIHATHERINYVRRHLIPSMLRQGIKPSNIDLYVDNKKEGLLKAFIQSATKVKGTGTWHLQDDVIISSDFKDKTEQYDQGIVCGFCNSYSKGQPGEVEVNEMWYSMPCIRIPDDILQDFVVWLKNEDTYSRFHHYIDDNKHDDVLFQFYLKENYVNIKVWNLAPNIVNHIDHLIGGSLINSQRVKPIEEVMSSYWTEQLLLDELKRDLQWEV